MILTEEEAKTKRCQESFGDGFRSPDGNTHMSMGSFGYAVQASPSYCISSGCMAWRWHGWRGPLDGTEQHVGYCGKAGAPTTPWSKP